MRLPRDYWPQRNISMDPRKQQEEDYSVALAVQDDAYVDAETEQDDAATAKWAEDDYQLKQEIDREQSGTQIIAESNAEYQEWLTGEEEKLWAFEHENPGKPKDTDINKEPPAPKDVEALKYPEEETHKDIWYGNEVGPVQKTCVKCNRIHRRLFAHATPIGDYCSGCGGLLVDTSRVSTTNLTGTI